MSQVFLSYARQDQLKAEALAAILAQQGWSVWWDRAILAGRSFEDVIERELQAARVVVVLWSRASVASSWVRNEAAEGMKRGVLVPARIDDATIPLGFRGIQTADLSEWNGDEAHGELGRLIGSIAEALTAATPAPPLLPVLRPRRLRPLEGIILRMAVSFAAGLTYPSAPPEGGLLIAVAMVAVSALAVWARRHRPLAPALLAVELELLVLGILFAAGVTLERDASPWAEWPDLVKHFWRVLLRGWVSLALLAAVAQWVTSRYVGPVGADAAPATERMQEHSRIDRR